MTVDEYSGVPFVKTPLIYSNELSLLSPCKIFLKQEFVQPTGSYKLRGISNLIKSSLDAIESHIDVSERKNIDDTDSEEKKVLVLSNSGGNAGNAVSYASNYYNVESVVVLPKCAKLKMKQKIENNGSRVIVHGETIGDSESYIKNVLIPSLDENVTPIYCHPYDLSPIWDGHSTIIDEIVDQLNTQNQLKNLKGIVCSIGGGGLYNGIVQGLKRNNLCNVPVLTIETDSFPTFNNAIQNENPVLLKDNYHSIVTSLACPYISSKSWENYKSHKTRNLLVSDSDAVKSCIRFAEDLNVIVEPACGVALCSVYDNLLEKHADFFGGLTSKEDIVVVIVCGGSATSVQDLADYSQQYLC